MTALGNRLGVDMDSKSSATHPRLRTWARIIGALLLGTGILLAALGYVTKQRSSLYGAVALAELEPFGGSPGEYLSFRPHAPRGSFPRPAFVPIDIRRAAADRNTVEAGILLREGGVESEAQLDTFSPLETEDATLAIAGMGPAPELSLWDLATQTLLYRSFVKLDLARAEDGIDDFEIAEPQMKVRVSVNEDESTEGAPAIEVWVVPGDAPEGYEAHGLLTLGKGLEFGTYLLGYEDYRDWGMFRVYRRQTRIPAFIAWVLSGVGLLLLLKR